MENNMISFLKRAAEQSGFQREVYIERNIPTLSSNICFLPFFGDLRSTCILSEYILKSYKEHTDKYLVLCSWPGFQHLFPYVDEYWSIKDNLMTENLAIAAKDFHNSSDTAVNYTRSLIRHFENVLSWEQDFDNIYRNGFGSKYFETFKEVKRFLPEVPSVSQMAESMCQQLSSGGKKVLLYPAKQIRSWQRGSLDYFVSPREFWVELTQRLIDAGIRPVVYQNPFTHDLSPDFTDRCIYLVSKNIGQVMAVMRSVGLVLDVYSGISRLANLARTPFISVDERLRFVNQKEYELDDLGVSNPKKYIFSFATMLLSGGPREWGLDVLDQLIETTNNFLPILSPKMLASTKESYESADYEKVRVWKAKKLGASFIRKY